MSRTSSKKTRRYMPDPEKDGLIRRLGGDTNWEGYGGTWAARAPSGAWYVLRFEHLAEYDEGAVERGEMVRYEGSVLYVDLPWLLSDDGASKLAETLRTCGWHIDGDGDIISDMGDIVSEKVRDVKTAETRELVVVEAAYSHGLFAVLETFTGGNPKKESDAAARKVWHLAAAAIVPLVEGVIDPDLDSSEGTNRVGSTRQELARGDLWAALRRCETPEAELMCGIYAKNPFLLGGGMVPFDLQSPESVPAIEAHVARLSGK